MQFSNRNSGNYVKIHGNPKQYNLYKRNYRKLNYLLLIQCAYIWFTLCCC